jgi:preprotein translocase subunit SecF
MIHLLQDEATVSSTASRERLMSKWMMVALAGTLVLLIVALRFLQAGDRLAPR